ncbi:L,D-transpeptidase [Variovorax sp. 38R]|nr:L,D-transpeptidase [Variovorax sp. 38R]
MAVPADVRQLAQAAVGTRDNQGLAFAVVDKKSARVFIYGDNGRLQGASPVLLGLARGDESVPGVGERKMSDIRPEERTTPAGRFVSEPGINLQGEDIVWVDYDAAVSMHRVRTNNRAERRLERLASTDAEEHRISYGCINVPAPFYDIHVKPVFGKARGLIYVLPEGRPAREYFKFLPTD